jgi:hypothetical protein
MVLSRYSRVSHDIVEDPGIGTGEDENFNHRSTFNYFAVSSG